LKEFNYIFEYFPGKENTIADMLRRYSIVDISIKGFEEVKTVEEIIIPASV
jgi:hypothetical protein